MTAMKRGKKPPFLAAFLFFLVVYWRQPGALRGVHPLLVPSGLLYL